MVKNSYVFKVEEIVCDFFYDHYAWLYKTGGAWKPLARVKIKKSNCQNLQEIKLRN